MKTILLTAIQELGDGSINWADWITAFSTVVLTGATIALAYLTRQLALATRSPFIVASIEPNGWAPTVILDIHLANEGTAAAYDVELSFDPALPQEREGQKHLERTSVLRAGQSITSALVKAKLMIDTTYQVTIEWSAKPNGKRSRTSYSIDVSTIKGMRFINGGNPIFRISDDVKKLREQIDRIAKKQTRIQIDSFSEHDRDKE